MVNQNETFDFGMSYPAYIDTIQQPDFPRRLQAARQLLSSCTVCPRRCRINRLQGEVGECGVPEHPIISSYFPHFGEEAPLVGSGGSGTIFIAGCNLGCVFCQNYEISHLLEGRATTPRRFAEMMLELQEAGCHNINIVTPSHIVPQLLEAVYLAARQGLRLPLVYNTSGYDSLASLRFLNGVVDIYMPDFKFWDDRVAARYTRVSDYATVARQAIREMHRQVGDLVLDSRGIARRGLLVRHLVMPGTLEQSRHIFHFLAQEISRDTYVNVMAQYRPMGQAHRYPDINRRLRYNEYQEALQLAREAGLWRFDRE